MKVRSLLYRLASLLGDLNAIEKGPKAIVTCIIRKMATKSTSGLLNRLFRQGKN